MRVVLELAGVRNCFGKQLGTANPLNNARATIEGLRALRTFKQVCVLSTREWLQHLLLGWNMYGHGGGSSAFSCKLCCQHPGTGNL